MDIKIETTGNFNNLRSWLKEIGSGQHSNSTLNDIGKAGVTALANATPVNTGETAASWEYEVNRGLKGSEVSWYNTGHPSVSGNIAVMLHTGYVTGTGGYVPARPYITTAIEPIYSEASYKLVEAMMNG